MVRVKITINEKELNKLDMTLQEMEKAIDEVAQKMLQKVHDNFTIQLKEFSSKENLRWTGELSDTIKGYVLPDLGVIEMQGYGGELIKPGPPYPLAFRDEKIKKWAEDKIPDKEKRRNVIRKLMFKGRGHHENYPWLNWIDNVWEGLPFETMFSESFHEVFDKI